MKKYFKPLYLLGGFILCVILHNLIYAVFKFEEPFFFFLAQGFFLALIVSVVYHLYLKIKRRS